MHVVLQKPGWRTDTELKEKEENIKNADAITRDYLRMHAHIQTFGNNSYIAF